MMDPRLSMLRSTSPGVTTIKSMGTGTPTRAMSISVAFLRFEPSTSMTMRRSTSLSGPADPRAHDPKRMIRCGLNPSTIRWTTSSSIDWLVSISEAPVMSVLPCQRLGLSIHGPRLPSVRPARYGGRTMHPLETYLSALYDACLGGGVAETSGYAALANLLNEVGGGLKPKTRCILHPHNQGAGIADGGLSVSYTHLR